MRLLLAGMVLSLLGFSGYLAGVMLAYPGRSFPLEGKEAFVAGRTHQFLRGRPARRHRLATALGVSDDQLLVTEGARLEQRPERSPAARATSSSTRPVSARVAASSGIA